MATPPYLSGTDEIEPQDLIAVWSSRNRDTRRVSAAQFSDSIADRIENDLDIAVASANASADIAQAAADNLSADLSNKANKSDLAATYGAGLVGTTNGTVQQALDSVQAIAAISVKQTDVASFLYAMSTAEKTDASLAAPTIDLSGKVQSFIDANKGKRLVFPAGMRYLMAGVVMDGTSYNGTELVFQGELFLKARPTTTSATYQGAWVGLLIKDCSNVRVEFRGHGNRTNQPDEEHVYLMGLAGVRNLSIPTFYGREIRGDGLYIGQKEWTSESANTLGVNVGLFDVVNSVSDGRNALSLISGDNIAIGTFRSINVGAVVGVTQGGLPVTQPGGFDIEPDKTYQSCKNITIGSMLVVHAGTSGLAIQGKAGFDVTNNIVIGDALIVNTCASTVTDGAGSGAITQSPNHTLLVASATDVSIGTYRGAFTNTYGDAVIIGNSKRVYLKGSVRRVREGARLANDDLDATGGGLGLQNSEIVLDVSQTCRFGIRTGKLTSSKVSGRVSEPVAGFYDSSLFGVISFTYIQKDVEYSVSVQHSPLWIRSYRNDGSTPATFDNTVIKDCDLSGSTWADPIYQFGDMKVSRASVRGVTDRATAPPALSNIWVDGQRFINSSPGGLDVPLGWRYDATAGLMRPMLANPFRRYIGRNYQLTENFDASLYDIFSLNIQANGALTYNAPTGGTVGQELTIRVRNVSGGAMGTITWNAAFKMSGWTNPATGKSRSVTFFYDGTSWIEISQTLADVAN